MTVGVHIFLLDTFKERSVDETITYLNCVAN